MQRPLVAILALFTLVSACGAPPGARNSGDAEGSIQLRRTYEEGTRYKVRFVVDAAVPAANRIVRTQIDADAVVTSVSETGTATLALVVDGATLELPLHPITIGAAHQGLEGVRALYDVDKRGRLRGDADIEGNSQQQQALQASLGAFLWARPTFPAGRVAEGDSWEAPVDWGWVGDQLNGGDRDLTYVFEGLREQDGAMGDAAILSIEGRTSTDTVEVGPGATIQAHFRLEGESVTSLTDGMTGHGTAQATARFDTTGQAEQMVAGLPSRWAVEWCVTPEGTDLADVGCGEGDLLAPREPDPSRPVATLYTGDSCEPRLTEMRGTLRQIPDNPSPPTPSFALPVLADGAEVFEAEGPALEIEGEEIRVDGRALSIGRTIEALETLREQWAQLRPGTEPPAFLYIQADAEAPLATVGPYLQELADADWELRLVVTTGEDIEAAEASHPSPEWLDQQFARLGAATPTERAMAMAALMGVALGGCAQALAAFSALGSADFAARADLIRVQLPSAVEACGCQALDIDALEVLLLDAGGTQDAALRWINFPLSGNDEGQRLRLGRNPTVSKLVEVLSARRGDGAVRLP